MVSCISKGISIKWNTNNLIVYLNLGPNFISYDNS